MARAVLAVSLGLLVSVLAAQTPPKGNSNLAPNSNSAQTPNSTKNPNSGQAPVKKNPLVAYAGNWIGAFENKPWILLNLSLVGDKFSGSLQRTSKFDIGDDGEVKHVSDDFITLPLTDAILNPDGLLITLKHPDTQETERFVMKLTGDSTAEIKMIAMKMPPGMSKPKPWKLMKVK